MELKRHGAIALEHWTTGVFAACDVPLEHAALAAAGIVRSELRGYRTHGMTRIASYVERLQSAVMNPRPAMCHRECPGGIVLDADGGMGHIAGPRALTLALEALATSASVLVVIQSCGHLGALGIHALLAAEAGALCVVGQRNPPLVAMPGFARPAIGNNPVAFSCPVRGAPPIVFDMACSVAARGQILLAAREGRRIPEGWALDDRGDSTTDAQRALHGMLLPAGGHKGIGVAMMVECLAGALSASANAFESDRNVRLDAGAPGRQGAFLWLVKPDAFVDSAVFGEYMTAWIALYVDAGGDHARLPGARGDRLEREGRANGIELAETTEQELRSLSTRLRVPFPA